MLSFAALARRRSSGVIRELAQPTDAIIGAMAAGANREVWIGLVEVVPEEVNDIFDGAPGADANVLAIAASVEDYMAVTAPALLHQGLIAVGVDDPEPLRERRSRVQPSDEILDLDERARKGDVVWDTF